MTDNPAVDAYWTEYERLWNQTVDALTAAVRLDHPEHGQADFADFLSSAIRATVANVGSVDTALAGRPGSWEADKVAELLRDGAGSDRVDLVQYRTERVIVPLNVEDLVDEAWQCGHDAGELLPYGEADIAAGASDELREDVYRRYAAGYRAYAERFVAAVYSAAWDTPGLASKQVSVLVETDPDYQPGQDSVTNPNEFEGDWLVRHLWSKAFAAVGMPTVPSDTAEM